MATTVPGSNLIPLPAIQRPMGQARAAAASKRRKKISREAGQALEILGHAIEYLADEFSFECMTRQPQIAPGMHPRVVAIEVLKACNREVYACCPEVPTLGERFRLLIGLR